MKKSNKIYNLKELYLQEKNNDKDNTPRNFCPTFRKLSKLNVNFPLEFVSSESFDKSEMKDTINIEYFDDDNIKKRIRKSLYYELNSFDYDNGNYWEYKKSIPMLINYIYDINILPHIKNKFLYKPISNHKIINDIIFSRNVIRKEVATSLNRYVINKIRKEKLEKEEREKREKKLRELSKTNKLMIKLYLNENEEDLPDLTSGEIVELNDYFGKNIDYKYISIPNDKLRKVVYNENFFFKKYKTDNK